MLTCKVLNKKFGNLEELMSARAFEIEKLRNKVEVLTKCEKKGESCITIGWTPSNYCQGCKNAKKLKELEDGE